MAKLRTDLAGKTFTYLTVISFACRDTQGKARWQCTCKCGNKRVVDGYKLTSGSTKSCGCYNIEQIKKRNFKDIAGNRYGNLKVLRHTGQDRHTHHRWDCLCDCGNISNTDTGSLISGKTKSCGCLIGKSIKHGDSRRSGVTVEYRTWCDIKKRCYNASYRDYKYWGERGITVCDRWLRSYENFLADMGRRPDNKMSIDRINNSGNYSPDNCRWADYVE